MSLDLRALKPGDRLPWRGKVWTVVKWTEKHHPPHPSSKHHRMVGACTEPILVLRASDGGTLRIGPLHTKWPAFFRDMESIWLVTQPAALPAWAQKLGHIVREAMPEHCNIIDGHAITALPEWKDA